MNNQNVDIILQDCDTELTSIGSTISSSPLSPISRHLTMYALIKSCSTIERSYKRIIADYYIAKCPELSPYFEKKVVNSSTNPSYESICSLIKDFNSSKESLFKTNIQAMANHEQVLAQLHSLVSNRNNFAHGQTVTCSFADIMNYYTCAKSVLVCMDNVIR